MKRAVLLLAALLAAILVPLVLGGSETIQRLRDFPLGLLLAMFGMILLCWVLNALRLRLLLGNQAREITPMKSIGVVMSTEFAICATPGGSGGPLTLMALLSRNGIGSAKSSAVFATDQLSDLLFFLCALVGMLFYALFHTLSQKLEWMLGLSAALMLVGLCACIGLAHYYRHIIKFNGLLLKRLSTKSQTRRRWARKLLHFRDALAETLKMPKKRLALVFLLTCLHWGLRYSVLYLALRGLGTDVQWAWSFLIQMLSLSAGQLSLLPGGAGAAELTSAALLTPMVGNSTAAAAIVVWRIVTYYFYLIAGGPVFFLLISRPLINKLLRVRDA